MSIKGISDKRRLPRLGKIRLGEKAISGKGKEYPKALDYFNCPDEVLAVYGDEPRELDIMFPVDDAEVIFPQWLKRYGSSKGLVCRGDGETAVEFDSETGEGTEIDCNPEECEAYQKKHCRRVASLQFMLPKVPGFGVWQIDTTSYHSIVNLNSCFDMIRGLCGRIHGIPLTLRLEPKEVRANGSKKVVHVLNLSTPLTLQQMLQMSKAPALQLEAPKPSEKQPTDLYAGVAKAEPEENPGSEFEDDAEIQKLCVGLNISGNARDALFRRFHGKRDSFMEYLKEQAVEKVRDEPPEKERKARERMF